MDYCIDILMKINKFEARQINKDLSKTDLFRALRTLTTDYDLGDRYYKQEKNHLEKLHSNIDIISEENIREKLTDNIYIYRGDITHIKVDAIVNAANEQGLGCFIPFHACIDNAIHSYAGLGLRRECNEILKGGTIPTGNAIITNAYSLPSKYVLHTVGPNLNDKDILSRDYNKLLADCYKNCLKICKEKNIKSLAICSISTGVFGFPIEDASQIALDTIRDYLKSNGDDIKVIINVFSKEDYDVYKETAKRYK